MQETCLQPLRPADPLEEGWAARCSIPAWRTPRTEELAGYSPRVPKSQTRPSH